MMRSVCVALVGLGVLASSAHGQACGPHDGACYYNYGRSQISGGRSSNSGTAWGAPTYTPDTGPRNKSPQELEADRRTAEALSGTADAARDAAAWQKLQADLARNAAAAQAQANQIAAEWPSLMNQLDEGDRQCRAAMAVGLERYRPPASMPPVLNGIGFGYAAALYAGGRFSEAASDIRRWADDAGLLCRPDYANTMQYCEAATTFGAMLEIGCIGSKDPVRALAYYETAANNGYALGAVRAALMYEGNGVPQNLERAIGYYRRAAALNVPHAGERADELALASKRAMEAARQAAEQEAEGRNERIERARAAIYYQNLGVSAAQNGDYPEALRYLRAAVRYDSESGLPQAYLNDVLERMAARGMTVEMAAAEVFGAGPNDTPDSPDCIARVTAETMKRADMPRKSAEFQMHLGTELRDRCNHSLPDVARAYEAGVRLNPRNGSNWWSLADVQMQMGAYDKAVESLKANLALEPKDAQLIATIGTAYAALGRRDDAIRQWDKAYKMGSMIPMVVDEINTGRAKFGLQPLAMSH